MKTYAEQQNKKPFDWNKLLDKAIYEGLTEEEHDEALNLSFSWNTCPVGNMSGIIPRKDDGEPVDELLIFLGSNFAGEIECEQYENAKETLEKIEKRSAYLIKKLQS